MDALDRHRVEVVEALASSSFDDDQSGLHQHGEVIHDPVPRHAGMPIRELPRRSWPQAQGIQDVAPRPIGQGVEDGVVSSAFDAGHM
jgi:hypothetical protein